MQRESFLEKLKQQSQLKQLETQSSEKARQLHQRDSKITQLQSLLAELHMKQMQQSSDTMQENQQSLDWGNDPLHDMLVYNLSNLLKEREEQGMGLHLASQDKNEELNKLKLALVEKQQLILQLSTKQQVYHEKEVEQSDAMDQLQKENEDLRSQNEHLGTLLNSKETENMALKKDQQNLRILLESKNPFENIINQNQQSQMERQQLAQESQALRQLLALEVNDQLQGLKKTINNYEWKLFCLETQLDLSNKEKKQYKYVNDKNEQRLNEYENQIKDQILKIYSMQQQLKRSQDENKILKMELCNKKATVQALQCQIECMNEEQNWEQLKELKYRVKEKDEELQEITNYLKEKITECHEYKVKASLAQKQSSQLHQKIEMAEEQNYQLEQAMIQTEDQVEGLKSKLQQSVKENDFLNNKINQMSLMFSLRIRQLEETLKQFEPSLKEKVSKISELTIELTQKNEQLSKKQQQVNKIQAEIQDFKKKQIRLQEDKQQVNQQCKYLRLLLSTKQKEAQKLSKKNDTSQKQLKEKEKIIQMIQLEMKNSRADLKEMRLSNRRCLQQLEQLREVARVSDQKIRILKKQSMQNIEKQMRFVFEMQQLQKSLQLLSEQKKAKQTELAEKSVNAETLSKSIKTIQSIASSRIQQIQQWLKNPSRGYEETTTFEILDEEDNFEVMQSQAERDRNQISKMILEFNSQLKELFEKIQ